jgi:hypothetical protein
MEEQKGEEPTIQIVKTDADDRPIKPVQVEDDKNEEEIPETQPNSDGFF